jgi:hypothetical protein
LFLGEGHLDCIGLLAVVHFNGTKNLKKKKKTNLLCFYFCVFLVAWQVMTKEVGEIV